MMFYQISGLALIEKKNPLKQGLKPILTGMLVSLYKIEKKNPLKQGLKQAWRNFRL